MATSVHPPVAASASSVAAVLGGLDSPQRLALDADRLLAHVLNCSVASLRAFPERELSQIESQSWQALVERRRSGEPFAYLVGKQEFWSIELAVGPGVLVPRADSECLIEAALQRLPAELRGVVADVGTGSGNLALALSSERPGLQIVAIELNCQALAWSRRNIRGDHAQLQLIRADGLTALRSTCLCAVISNPPYIAADDPDLDPATGCFEPAAALLAEEQGMAVLRRLAQEGLRVLRPNGWLFLEHGWKQAGVVIEILQNLGYRHCTTELDLAGRPRVSLGQRPG